MVLIDSLKFKIHLPSQLKRITLLMLVLYLSSCASILLDKDVRITTPATDNRQYEYMELSNGLKVLMISDSNTTRSAAAMNVGVGTAYDPKNRQGLAHFLEHMLFLGTKKYPETGEYQRFINTHGGNNNAYTAFENTNYFFDIDEQSFDPALDRFATFFISPTFDQQYLDREKNAVNAEFNLGYQDDSRRTFDAIKDIANPKHPFSKFSTGNLETLGKKIGGSLKKETQLFYDKHYYASNMYLVVLDNAPLNKIKQSIIAKFSHVPQYPRVEKSALDKPQDTSQPVFTKGTLPAKLYIQSVKDIYHLKLMFLMPNDMPLYKINPSYYLSNFIGHEGKNSLLSELKKRGWAEGLSAGGSLSVFKQQLYGVNINLTPKGREHVDEVVKLFFQTVERIKQEGITSELYQEQTEIAQLSFDYQEQGHPYEYVSELASRMQEYPPQDVLVGPYTFSQFDKKTIKEVLSYINPQNMLAVVLSNSELTSQESTWYNTGFRLEKISKLTTDSWENHSLTEAIKIPEPNPYLVKDLSLVNLKRSQDWMKVKPKKLLDDNNLQVWHIDENTFEIPKATISLRFKSALPLQNAKNYLMNSLYSSLVSDVINEESYEAYLSGLNLSISGHAFGLSMHVSGFNDKQDKLIDSVLKQIKQSRIDAARFKNIVQEYRLALQNKSLSKPYIRTYDLFRSLLQKPAYSDQELLQILDAIQVSDVEQYRKNFWNEVSAEMLVNGNMQQQDVKALSNRIRSVLPSNQSKTIRLALASVKGLKQKNWTIPAQHNDVAVQYYLQGDNASNKEHALFMMTAQMLQALFYYELRTEQQLGYLVNANYFPRFDVPGISFIVQSSNSDAKKIETAIKDFVNNAYSRYATKIIAEEFEKNRAAVLAQLLSPPLNQQEQSDGFWEQIALGQSLDWKMEVSDEVALLTFDEWQNFVKERLTENKDNALMMQSYRNAPQVSQNEIEKWRNGASWFWLVQ